MAESLEGMEGAMNWKACMGILQDVEQKGTTWSIAYSPTARDLRFSVYKDWGTVYHLSIP